MDLQNRDTCIDETWCHRNVIILSLQFVLTSEEESVRYLRGLISGQILTKDLYQQKTSCKQPSAKEEKKKKKKKTTYRAAHVTEDTAEETHTVNEEHQQMEHQPTLTLLLASTHTDASVSINTSDASFSINKFDCSIRMMIIN